MLGGGYFGQDYLGGSPLEVVTPTTADDSTRTLVVHLDVNVAATGTATQFTDAVWALRITDARLVSRTTDVALSGRLTNALLTSRSTDAALTPRITNPVNFRWLVSP